MKTKIYTTLLLAIGGFCTSFAGIANLTGAWKGPKDLMINVCVDNQSQPYICHCGIYRTFGWVNFSTTVSADSLIMVSTDTGSPFKGRFRIESGDRLVGKLEMGSPGDEWYYNGEAELVRQKPIMPENLNHDLEGIVLPADYGILSLARDKARDVLSTLSPESYGYSEKSMVEKLLNAKTYPITPDDMIGFRRVRSIQIDARDGIFSYPYFNCRFRKADGKIFFEKTSGSQRKSGVVYQNDPESLVFLGGWSVNDDPQTEYGGINSVAGTVYKIGPRKALMIFPTDVNRVEIYELKYVLLKS